MLYLLPIIAPVAVLYGATRFLKGENLSKYDEDIPVTFECDPDSDGLKKMNAYLFENFEKPAKGHSGGEPVSTKRERFEQGGLTRDFPKVTFTPLSIPAGWGDIGGEWVTTKKSDPDKRILYIHGGAFTVGSAISHRPLTSKLAELTGASVCAINYRLMPEHKRMASVKDSRTAYKWILENGPDGPFSVKKLAVAGDSAGGNLTLSTIQWARNEGLRPADAVVALSPATDGTFSGSSIRDNIDTDHMLRPMVKNLVNIPQSLLLWGSLKQLGVSPSNPSVSPIFGDLADLPPTLIHASSAEILYDDARRYAAKARAAGSDVKLQTWSHMPHVWQIFDTMLPEANDALKEIAAFLKSHGL
ncbi:MAG: alpha/beta hydrolase [Robiginitomaculum sp.]|nr:alpha/beta hydrolase [Robiginitomaculum sp.]